MILEMTYICRLLPLSCLSNYVECNHFDLLLYVRIAEYEVHILWRCG